MKIAIIGCGRVARNVHVPAFTEIKPSARFRLFDVRADIVDDLVAQTPGALAFLSLDEALEGAELAAICSPNSTHAEYIRICMERAIPCLCEKPVTHTPETIGKLLALQDKSKSATYVNLPYVASPIFSAVHDLFGAQSWASVELEFSTLGLRFWRPLTDWYDKPLQSGGGAVLDLGAHAIHFLEQASRCNLEIISCTALSAPLEDDATLEGRLGIATARIRIDRRAKRPAFILRLRGRDGLEWVCDVLKGELCVSGKVVESCGAFDSQGAVKLFAARRPLERFSMDAALSAERKVYDAYAAAGTEGCA